MIAYWLKHPIEKVANLVIDVPIYMWSKKQFDFKVKGLENLPDRSAIIVPNHCLMIDGFLIKPFIRLKGNRTIHFLIQGGKVYNTFKPILWAWGQIPVDVDSRSSNKIVIKRTLEYLARTKDLIGIFSEGPTKDLVDESGKIMPIEERQHYRGAAWFSFKAGAPIVPIGIRADEDVERENWKYELSKIKEGHVYLQERVKEKGRVRYYVNIGQPIFYNEKLDKKEAIRDLTARVKNEMCHLAQTARDI